MSEFSLRKAEKLCSRTAVDKLFASGTSAVAYPLRMVYQISDRSYGAPAQFMITIPKKKIRKAVGRVLLRRRIREAYVSTDNVFFLHFWKAERKSTLHSSICTRTLTTMPVLNGK